eukprot:m.11163 g.11163  ORF g.11163 m.11163 type:complete len:408 (+) comp4383_c0_seq2:99-1322(+)
MQEEAKETPAAADVLRLNVWSGPRCLSTTLMRSFAERDDTKVVDEPLYAYYLSTHPEKYRPYREEIVKYQSVEGDSVVQNVLLAPCEKKILYCKHIAKQIKGIDKEFLLKVHNVILTRHPLGQLASFGNKLEEQPMDETCFEELVDIQKFLQNNGRDPYVIDVQDLQDNTEDVLKGFCEHLGIEFQESMLSWEKGRLEEYGIWADFWYDAILKSTGFRASGNQKQFRKVDLEVLGKCLPLYNKLRQGVKNVDINSPIPRKDNDVLVLCKNGIVSARGFLGIPDVALHVSENGGVCEVVETEDNFVLGLTEAVKNLLKDVQDCKLNEEQVIQLTKDTIIANKDEDGNYPGYCYIAMTVSEKSEDPDTLMIIPQFSKPNHEFQKCLEQEPLTCGDYLFNFDKCASPEKK